MPVDVSRYPSPIARPYELTLKDTPQRKDYQRFLLENTVSFLASLSVSSLIDMYRALQHSTKSESEAEGDSSRRRASENELDAIHQELVIDLKQMSLGKWTHVLRSTTAVMRKLLAKAPNFMPELIDFYHGANAKDVVSTIDKLITLRNQDAHASPIAAEDLARELDRRQELLDKVIESIAFIRDYRFVHVDDFEIREGQQLYSAKEFIGDGYERSTIASEQTLPINELICCHRERSGVLRLAPLMGSMPIDDQDVRHLAIYSKLVKGRTGMIAQYISLDGKSTIDVHALAEETSTDFDERARLMFSIYADPSNEPVFEPNLALAMAFGDSVMQVNELGQLVFSVANMKSTRIRRCTCVVEFPKSFTELSVDSPHAELDEAARSIKIDFDALEDGAEHEVTVDFVPKEQGHFFLKTGLVTFEYLKRKSEDREEYDEQEMVVDGEGIEVRDPNLKDQLCPVINVHKRYYPAEGELIEVGNPFIFELKVENIGFGPARDVRLELVFPAQLALEDGLEEIKTSLNPFETKTFRYVLSTREPDIYKVNIRSITYFDGEGRKYATHADEDFRVLVRSNIFKMFKYQMEDAYDDLYLSDAESRALAKVMEEYAGITDKVFHELESQAIVKVFRKAIRTLAVKKNLEVREEIFQQSERQSDDPAKAVVFKCRGIPFFAIDVTRDDDIVLYSLKTKIADDNLEPAIFAVTDASFVLSQRLAFEAVKRDKSKGKSFFYRWINTTLKVLVDEYLPWRALAKRIADEYEAESFELGRDLYTLTLSDELVEALDLPSVRAIHVQKDLNQSGEYLIVLRAGKRLRESGRIKGFSFLALGDRYCDEDHCISTTFRVSERFTYRPGIALRVLEPEAIDVAIERLRLLFNELVDETSRSVLKDDQFSRRMHMDVLSANVERLIDAEVAIRPFGDWALGFYCKTAHRPAEVTPADCVAILRCRGKKRYWLHLNVFKEPPGHETFVIKMSIGLYGRTGFSGRGWDTYVDEHEIDAETIQAFIDFVIEQAQCYSSELKAIFPGVTKFHLCFWYVQTQVGFLAVVSRLLDGEKSFDELEDIFRRTDVEELEAIRRTFGDDYGFWRREGPLEIVGTGRDRLISINEAYRAVLEELFEQERRGESVLELGCLSQRAELLYELRASSSLLWSATPKNGNSLEAKTKLAKRGKLKVRVWFDEAEGHGVLMARVELTSPDEMLTAVIGDGPVADGALSRERDGNKAWATLTIPHDDFRKLAVVGERESLAARFKEFFDEASGRVVEKASEQQFAFWRALEAELRKRGLDVADGRRYDAALVHGYYTKGPRYFGLFAPAGASLGVRELGVYVAVDWTTHCGLCLFGEGGDDADLEELRALGRVALPEMKVVKGGLVDGIEAITWKPTSVELDFYCHNERVKALARQEEMSRTVADVARDVSGLWSTSQLWAAWGTFLKSASSAAIERAELTNVAISKWFDRNHFGVIIEYRRAVDYGQYLYFGLIRDLEGDDTVGCATVLYSTVRGKRRLVKETGFKRGLAELKGMGWIPSLKDKSGLRRHMVLHKGERLENVPGEDQGGLTTLLRGHLDELCGNEALKRTLLSFD